MITEKMSFAEVERLPGWDKIARYIMEARPTTREKYQKIRLDAFNYHGKNKVVDALNFVSERINDEILFDYYSSSEINENEDLKMTKILYFRGTPNAPYVVVCPGGGYHNVVTYLEGFPAAKCFCEKGYHVFIVTYRTRIEGLLPKPMHDLHRALQYIQSHAQYFQLGKKYAVMGCSAGGHLVSELMSEQFGYEATGLNKPDGLVLCYAPNQVRFAEDLLEDGFSVDDFNVLTHLKYPLPVYTFHCKDDPLVPVEQFYQRIEYFETHNYPIVWKLHEKGGHGLQDDHPIEEDDWFTPIRDYLDIILK